MDYSVALDKFRRVSKLKKTLEQRPPIRRKSPVVQMPAAVQPAKSESLRPVLDIPAMRAGVTPQQISSEEGKLLRVEESIRVFVRVADPKFRQIVPMRFFNLTLTPAEADAYGADYLDEKSMRAGAGRVLLRIVAVVARMTTELEELMRSENSASLWKLHADALVVLLEIASNVQKSAGRIQTLAEQEDDQSREKAVAIQASLQKLADCSERVLKNLASKPAARATSAGGRG
jgi:hypothetical protein